MKEKVLLMYSGGLDSILSMVKLIYSGYKVLLVHFDNGCTISIGDEVKKAEEFEQRYGTHNVEYIGKISNLVSFRENELEISNLTFSQIQELYGDCTISQIRCLNCRSAMYYEAIRYCLENNIKYIAEGARKSQLFSIEQPQMIKAYKNLCKKFDIELLLPVYDLDDDLKRIYELMDYGVLPFPGEDSCILGMPLTKPVAENLTDTVRNIFEKNIEPRYIKELKLNNKPPQMVHKCSGRIEFI